MCRSVLTLTLLRIRFRYLVAVVPALAHTSTTFSPSSAAEATISVFVEQWLHAVPAHRPCPSWHIRHTFQMPHSRSNTRLERPSSGAWTKVCDFLVPTQAGIWVLARACIKRLGASRCGVWGTAGGESGVVNDLIQHRPAKGR
jgi:hypothetical protein